MTAERGENPLTTEDRFMPARCGHRFSNENDLLRRMQYRCEYLEGHRGMHAAGTGAAENAEMGMLSEPFHWGSARQLAEERQITAAGSAS